MKDIKETKGRILLHIRSARNWLDQAEKAFDDESPTRGELNLILARAEVQHAQEKRSYSREFWVKLLVKLQKHKRGVVGMATGFMALLAFLYLPNVLTLTVHEANVPAARSSPFSVQLEAPAMIYGKFTASAVAQSEPTDRRTVSAEPNGNSKEDSISAVQKAIRPAEAAVAPNVVQEQSTRSKTDPEISEQELRVLMKTAERALKSTN